MMSIIATIEAQLTSGGQITPAALGGVQAIVAEADSLVAAPYLDVLVGLAEAAEGEDAQILDELVRRAFAVGRHPVEFRLAVGLVVESASLRGRLGHSLQRILELRIEERTEGTSALLAAYALEGLFRMALAGAITRHRPLAIMADLTADEAGLFAEHAAKLMGAAYHVWRDADLLNGLDRLRFNPDAESEAAFELGLGWLSCALTLDNFEEIKERLEAARVLFVQAIDAGENRADAVAYCAVVDLITGFASGAAPDAIQAPLAKLMAAVADRAIQHHGSELPHWLRPRADREVQWLRLCRTANVVARELARPSWLNASAVMTQLLEVYDADRTLQAGAGLDELLRPRIEIGIAHERGLLAHLDDLLQDERWVAVYGEDAARLRQRIARRAQESTASRKVLEGAPFLLRGSVLQDEQFIADLPANFVAQLEQKLRERIQQQGDIGNPIVQRIFKNMQENFTTSGDYQGAVRRDFDELILQVALFCKDRQDADRKELGGRGAYLHDPKASEFDLQTDLREWLAGNYTRADISTEVPGVAAGRADIYIAMGGHRFIIELKRHHGLITRESAQKYRGQASSYQATNVKLGMLGILELADRNGPAPSLEECVWHEHFVPQGSAVARHLLVFRVPGKRVLPYTLSR